jgi:hypothetical protein
VTNEVISEHNSNGGINTYSIMVTCILDTIIFAVAEFFIIIGVSVCYVRKDKITIVYCSVEVGLEWMCNTHPLLYAT